MNRMIVSLRKTRTVVAEVSVALGTLFDNDIGLTKA